MKSFKFIFTALVLAVATTVTAGSMYITVRAAALQQDLVVADAAIPIPAASPANQVSPAGDEIPAVPSVNDALRPDQILSSRTSTIVLDAGSGFDGRLSSPSNPQGAPNSASGYTVKVLQRGGVIGSTKTDPDGNFRVTGLQPGVSGILAFSETGLMLFGVRLVDSDDATAIAGIGEIDVDLDLDSAVVAVNDVSLAREMIVAALSNGDQRFTGDVTADEEAFNFGTGEPTSSLLARSVQLNENGTLDGEVSILDERTGRNREVLDMTVHFLRDGRVVATAEVEPNGSFVVSGLSPGIHSVIGTGLDGVFAIGVDILGSTHASTANVNSQVDEFVPASIIQSSKLSITAVGPGNVNSGNFQTVTDGTSAPETPVATNPAGGPGGFGGGSSGAGGGGAGGGGGGLGALLGGAIGAAAGYAAGQDNSDPSASP